MLGINMKNNLELVYRVKDHQRARGLDDSLRLLGYHSAAAEHLKELQAKIEPNNQAISSMISTYAFISHTSEIYNERLMKMDEMISWKNFKDLKAQATRNLKYFRDLRMAQLERKKRKLPKWKESFISKQTYDNMRTTVAGFFGFCEYIIEQAQILPNIPKNVKRKFAISPAQYNQSFGKAWFSFSRHMGFDTAAKYIFGITANLMSKVVRKSLEKKEHHWIQTRCMTQKILVRSMEAKTI